MQKELVALTTRFYAEQAVSFSDTRHASWPGWERVAQLVRTHCIGDELRILDVGCGNMRFEKFLTGSLAQRSLVFETIDNCPALIPEDLPAARIYHHELDVIGALIEGSGPWGSDIAPVDVACSFGVMHHVPDEQNRTAFLKALIGSVRPGGFAIVSLWRFMDVPALASKALETLELVKTDAALPQDLRAQLDELAGQGDYLLGWQNKPGVYRYCHSFDGDDIDALVASATTSAKLVERFRADGRSGNANEYLVLQKVNSWA